jgi:hypothetical protein
MNFATVVTTIQESHKTPETLEITMNFLDAITILQNQWKRNKLNKKFCLHCGTCPQYNYTEKELNAHIVKEIDQCRECNGILLFLCYCCP